MASISALNSPAAAQDQLTDEEQKAPASPRLIGESEGLVPGRTNTIAITFDIADDWHTYWPGQNDTGFPVSFELTPPTGFEAGEPLWPAPHRHESRGGILDHVYEQEDATILIPLDVPADARPGDRVRINADIEWLVCREACLPGWATVDLTLPILAPGETPRPGPDADRITSARLRLPIPLPKNATDVSIRWDRGVLEIKAEHDIKLITFSPHEKSRPIADLLRDGESKKGVLRLRPKPGDKPVRGVLELVLGGGARPLLYSIQTTPPRE